MSDSAAHKTVLVTGAGGFIGRHSVAPLRALGYTVHAVVGRSSRDPAPADLRDATLHYADLLDPTAIRELLSAVAPSHLLHFAWIATPGLYPTSADNYRWAAAGEWLLECFAMGGGQRAVMAGSCAEYDGSLGGLCDERASPLAGAAGTLRTPYAECKAAMQATLSAAGHRHGLSTAWGRVFFLYGPYEHPERLVASVIVHLLRGRDARCTHGRQIRSYLHVADVGAAFAALLDSAVEGPVNIGSAEPLALADLLAEIAAQIGRPELLQLNARAAPVGEPAVLLPATERLVREVGWQPRFTRSAGLADTIAWWRGALA